MKLIIFVCQAYCHQVLPVTVVDCIKNKSIALALKLLLYFGWLGRFFHGWVFVHFNVNHSLCTDFGKCKCL